MSGKRVAVIGSGLAGIAAAAWAQQSGVEVTVVDKGVGATAFSSGGLDVGGDPCAPPARPDAVNRVVRQNLHRLLLAQPNHPYAQIASGNEDPATVIISLLRETINLLFPNHASLALEGELERNQPCFTSLGTIKFTALFPENTARPDLPGMEKPQLLAFTGLSDLAPIAWIKIVTENAARLGFHLEPTFSWISFGAETDKTSLVLAQEISQNPGRFVEAILSAAKTSAASAFLLPPVLPLAHRHEILRDLAAALSRPVYELLSLPPSVPGLRLREHLLRQARHLGIQVLSAEVTGFEANGKQLRALTVNSQGRQEKIPAESFVLASGKFLAGGLRKERALREPIFNLPVFCEEMPPGHEFFTEKLLGLHVTGPHPIFAAGLRVDQKLRPVGADGSPPFENLFAAGSLLAHHNYLLDGAGSGVALATGAVAGKNAASFGLGE